LFSQKKVLIPTVELVIAAAQKLLDTPAHWSLNNSREKDVLLRASTAFMLHDQLLVLAFLL